MVNALDVGQQEKKTSSYRRYRGRSLNYFQAVSLHGYQWREIGATRETRRAVLSLYSLLDLADIEYLLRGLAAESLRMAITTFT